VDDRIATGSLGERAAADWYARRGYDVVDRNWRCALGELDLVLERHGVLVICEVKTRRGSAFGGGYEAVHARKRTKLRSLAEAYLLASRRRPAAIRIDVASVALRADGSAAVEVFEDAV
jgi:putative endonuclease